MARDPGLEAVVAEHLDGLPDLSGKPLFGGWCWLLRGHLLCGARNGGMLVRLGPGHDAWALRHAGIERMTVGPRAMPGWVWARSVAVADDGLRQRLIDAALAFVTTLPDKEAERPSRSRRVASPLPLRAAPARNRPRKADGPAVPRAILIVLDSVGCGAAEDADAYGDKGADTLGNIAAACVAGRANRTGLRSGPLRLPHLAALGLGDAVAASTGRWPAGLDAAPPNASWGFGIERSAGKDTPSGHWELAGTPVPFRWGYFRLESPCFPPALTEALVAEGGLTGILGNCHASGTNIIDVLGEAHLRTGEPICYTSVDSVFQIAAHEERFGLDRLYGLCRIARRLCDPLAIGRVIARPFLGDAATGFRRTPNRKDYAVPPPAGTLFDRAAEASRAVVSVGKIGDIFAHVHTGEERKGKDNDGNLDLVLAALQGLDDGGLIVANLVDFDSDFGHRRDVAGYAACLERFDRHLPSVLCLLRPDDLLIVTADHGNDPTFHGTDHTREHVPILGQCAARGRMAIGRRDTFADVGASIAAHLGLKPTLSGASFL